MSTATIPLRAVPAEGAPTPRRLAQMQLENDALITKLAQLAGVVRGLVHDLAKARRDARRKHQQVEAPRLGNARLRAHAPPSLLSAVGK